MYRNYIKMGGKRIKGIIMENNIGKLPLLKIELNELKIICNADGCIYNQCNKCRRTEITIGYAGVSLTPSCFDYKEL